MRELYSISCGGESVFFVELNADHAVFAGHFPGHPVLPGVCSMMIVRDCAGMMLGRRVRWRSVQSCKFMAAITPTGGRLTVTLNMGESVEAMITQDGKTVLKLRGTLVE